MCNTNKTSNKHHHTHTHTHRHPHALTCTHAQYVQQRHSQRQARVPEDVPGSRIQCTHSTHNPHTTPQLAHQHCKARTSRGRACTAHKQTERENPKQGNKQSDDKIG